MKKIFFSLLILVSFKSMGQRYQSMPQAGYGPIQRILIDSVLTIPIGKITLRNITGGRDTAQVRYNTGDSSMYIYSGFQWIKIGSGGGGSIDTTSLSNRINQRWTLTGNSATDSATNFLGTTEAKPLSLITNGILRGIISSVGNVGIGTTTPAAKLDVNGKISLNDELNYSSTRALMSIHDIPFAMADSNGGRTSFGFRAYQNRGNPSSINVTAFGYSALKNNTASEVTAIGSEAFKNNIDGDGGTAVGFRALYANIDGTDNTAVGDMTLFNNISGSGNQAFGSQAGVNITYGNTNNLFGSGGGITTGNFNTSMGAGSLGTVTTGSNNIAFGRSAGNNLFGAASSNISIGYRAMAMPFNSSNTLNIGNIIFGTNINGIDSALSSGNVGIGTTTPGYKLDVNGVARVQSDFILNDLYFNSTATRQNLNIGNISSSTSLYSMFFLGGGGITTGAYESNFFGLSAGANATGARNSNFFGRLAGNGATSALGSNFFGYGAGDGATNASQSHFFGINAGASGTNAGSSIFMGSNSGSGATNASSSFFAGYNSGYGATNANNTILIGHHAGLTYGGNNIGNYNIVIGQHITVPNSDSQKLNIGGILFGSGLNNVVAGNPNPLPINGGKIGINVVPISALHVSGTIRGTDSLIATGLVSSADTTTFKPLGINSSGNVIKMPYYQAGGGGGGASVDSLLWSQNGTNIFNKSGRNVGINNSDPSYPLDVTGKGRFTDTVFAPRVHFYNGSYPQSIGYYDATLLTIVGHSNFMEATHPGGSNTIRSGAGSGLLYQTPSGYLGINTYSIDSMLTVSGSGHIGTNLKVDNDLTVLRNSTLNLVVTDSAIKLLSNASSNSTLHLQDDLAGTEGWEINYNDVNKKLTMASKAVLSNPVLSLIDVSNAELFEAYAPSSIKFSRNGDSWFNTSKVGFGTTTPDSALHVATSAHVGTNLRVEGTILAARVGLGASPLSTLHVSGSIRGTDSLIATGLVSSADTTNFKPLGINSSGNIIKMPYYQAGGGSMIYPAAGIAVSTGAAWAASVTDNSTNWNTAYTDRLNWDGGATGLVAATGRTSLGGTTIGQNVFTSTNPTAITFGRANADNTFDWLSATDFKTALSLNNVTNESKATMFTNATFTGTFATAAGAIANAALANTAVTNLSGTNTGDNSTNTLYSGLVTNATHTGDATGSGALTVVALNGTNLAALGTGIMKNTTATGVPSIAIAGDFPTLNQNTTGSAATLTTTRTIWGQNFNGSANVTGAITLGANDLTMTGSLAATGARVTKGWFTDVESTNALTVGGVVVPTISSTNTLTNKRITARTGTTTSSATPTINTDNTDKYDITAQTVDITSMTTNLSGTATNGQGLLICITGTASRAITWGASFEASSVALPTTTSGTAMLCVKFIYTGTAWRVTGYY